MIDDPVPFSNEVLLGQLAADHYQLVYETRETPKVKRAFGIEKASVNTMDNFDYAVVQGIELDPIQAADKPLYATLSGVFTSRCADFARPLKVERVDDIAVILPVLKSNGLDCEREMRPFRERVEIGSFDPGSYLLHVRSRNGKAVNRTFETVTRVR